MKANNVGVDTFRTNNIQALQFINRETTRELKVIDFLEEPEKGQFIISLYSQLFSENQLKVFIRDNKVVIFVTEKINCNRTSAIYVSDWQNYFPQSYTRMRNVSLILPGDNFFLLRHLLIPEQFLLKIFLGRLSDN